MRRRLSWILLAGLWACEPKDLGPLFVPEPCGEACFDAGLAPDLGVPEVCTSTATYTCGQGACFHRVPACVDGLPNTCVPGLPSPEACNDVDDNCDGQVDEGCDDDRDGYCDSAFTVTSSPAICSKGGARLLDCDDQAPARHPGRTEICDDRLDNDCNDFADYLDINGCVHLTASFQDSDGVVTLEHGTSQVLQAVLTPPTLELERSWVVVGAVPDNVCQPSDVTLSEPTETMATTQRRVAILDDPSRLDCAYRLELHLGGTVADAIELRMRNTRPRVDALQGAALDDQTLVLSIAEGSNPRLLATTSMDPDQPVIVRWTGRDAGLLNCGNPCEGSDLAFRAPPAPGTYLFTLAARDAFDGISRSRNLRVEVEACVWARAGGTGSGTGPAQAEAYGSLNNAVTAAANLGANVCLVGTNRLNVGSSVTLPVGVGITGGFGTTGLPANTLGALRLNNGARIRFAPGHTGAIRRVVVDASQPDATLFEIIDASPSLFGVDLVLPTGASPKAVELTTTGAAGATVRLGSTNLRSNGNSSDAVGLEAHGLGSGVARLVWNGSGTVDLEGCSGTCRGIWIHGASSASLTAERVEVESSGPGARAIAIDVASEGGRTATAEIQNVAQIWAGTTSMDPGDETIGVRLSGTQGVRIADNGSIGATTQVAGRRFAAGIADGWVDRQGQVIEGASTGLVITGNRQIGPGRASYAYDDATCADEASAREGSDVAVGILLVGTSTAEVRRNGNTSSRDNGVFGGAISGAQDPSGRSVPPSAPGLWTIGTFAVQVIDNELRAGVISVEPSCAPSELPRVVAVRDGLPLGGGDRRGSQGLLLSRNGVVSSRRLSFDPVPDLDRAPTQLVELWGGPTAEVRLANNYLAATRGTVQVALFGRGPGRIEAWNNVLEVDGNARPGTSQQKRALWLSEQAPASVVFANNVLLLRQESMDVSDPVAIALDRAPQAFLRFDHNLLFVEASERSGEGAYVEVDGVMRWSRATFSDFATADFAAGNLIVPPLFRAQTLEHRRSITRLTVRSPAVDQGRVSGAPTEDRFGTARPIGAGPDIGHHELAPGE